MTDLTAAKMADIQETLEEAYKEHVEKCLPAFKDVAHPYLRDSFLDDRVEALAKSEFLLDQFNKINMSRLSDTERLDVQARLEKRKAQLIEFYENPEVSKRDRAEAVASFAECDLLLKNFKKVSQAQMETQINQIRSRAPATKPTGP